MEETVFTKIIKGEIPCQKVYEDEKTLAFMDIRPIQPGHVLVISKTPVEFVWDLSEEDYAALMETVGKVGRRIREVFTDKSHVGVIIEGLDVPHVHVKVFPFNNDDEFRYKPDKNFKADEAELDAIAKKLMF